MITQFTVGTSHTVNLGNFESTRIEASLTVSVAEGEDLEALKGHAQVELRKLLEETFRAQKRQK